MLTNAPAGGDNVPTTTPLRIKTGISDGAYTEVTDGLKEGDVVVTSVRLPQPETPVPTGANPFGGGGGGGFRGGGGGGGGRGR